MSLTNPFDDRQISDARTMRALAHPVRLAALSYLQQHGPATATQLSEVVGASPSVTSWHLRHLAGFGLVGDWDGGSDGRERWWQALARGISIKLDTSGGQGSGEQNAAYQMLGMQMLSQALDQVQTWAHDVRPRLDATWSDLAGTSNTRVSLTPSELDGLVEDVNALIAPYVHRRNGQAPGPGERPVRFLRIVMPGDGEDEPS